MSKLIHTSDDWPLVERIRKGDASAFAELVRRYDRQVANLAYLALGRREDVEDLTQDVFLRVYHGLNRLEPQRSLFSWIYRIAVNAVIDEVRRRKIRRVLSLEFLIEERGDAILAGGKENRPDFVAHRKESEGIVLAAIQQLPADQRVVIVLREYEDFTYEEISEILSISLPAVKTRLFRARATLRKFFQTNDRAFNGSSD